MLQRMVDLVLRSVGGLKLLGAAAEGKWKTRIDLRGVEAGPPAKRATEAEQLAQRVVEFVGRRAGVEAVQATCTVLHHCVALIVALSCYLGILSSGLSLLWFVLLACVLVVLL